MTKAILSHYISNYIQLDTISHAKRIYTTCYRLTVMIQYCVFIDLFTLGSNISTDSNLLGKKIPTNRTSEGILQLKHHYDHQSAINLLVHLTNEYI